MMPFELDLRLVVWVLKHRVPVRRQSHMSVMCSKLPVMRCVNGGSWVEILHLNGSNLGSVPDLVMVLLIKSCLPIACEMEAAFLPSHLDGNHHRAGTAPYCVLA